MEHSVAFVEPAGLGVDEIRERAPGERCGALGYSFGVEVINSSGAFGIEESFIGRNVYGRAEGSDAEFDDVFGGECGVYFDEAVVGGEILFVDFEAVEAKGEIANDGEAGIVGVEGAMELGGVAGKIDGSLDGLGVRAGDFKTEFAGVALSVDSKGEERENDQEQGEVETWTHGCRVEESLC
jgi:hypothetical protein